MKIRLIFLVVAFLFLSFHHENKNSDPTPSVLVFRKYRSLTESGIKKLEALRDSIIDEEYRGKDVSSAFTREVYKSVELDFRRIDTSNIKIHLNVISDSIWRFKTENDKAPNNYVFIDKLNRKLIQYDQSKKNIIKTEDIVSGNDREFSVSFDKNDTRIIHDYKCFKMKIVHKKADPVYGNTIYECYVSDEIDLPFFSIVSIPKEIPDLFPLEIKIKPEKSVPEMQLVYELVEIR